MNSPKGDRFGGGCEPDNKGACSGIRKGLDDPRDVVTVVPAPHVGKQAWKAQNRFRNRERVWHHGVVFQTVKQRQHIG